MNSPGFEIYNDTIWPLQVVLKQVGPLYYELVPPGGYFRRRTGAVWFTINASIALNNELTINDWHCVWPVAAIVGSVALGAITGGKGAFAIAAGTSAAKVGAGTAKLAALLMKGGLGAKKALVVSGTALGGLNAGAAASLLAKIFDNASSEVSRVGCYAGPPWPFRRRVHTYRITGAPYYRPINDEEWEIVYGKLYID